MNIKMQWHNNRLWQGESRARCLFITHIMEKVEGIDIVKHSSLENKTPQSVLIDLIQSDSRKWALCILYFV